MSNRLFLLDGSGYIYRAYYAVQGLSTTAGFPTNAIHGFARMLQGLIQEHSPTHLAVVFDRPRAELFRTQIYPEYKSKRESMPEELAQQVPYIKRLVEAMNIAAIEVPTFEADDVIATLARKYSEKGVEVTIVSGDKDLMQCVTPTVFHYDSMKRKLSGPADVIEKFGVPADLLPDLLGLAGDTSDNIPGVPGIGEKTASELLKQYPGVEEVLKWTHLISGAKRQQNLRDHADHARLSKELATVRTDVPVELCLAEMAILEPKLDELLPLLQELEMTAMAAAYTLPAPGVIEIYSDGSGLSDGRGGYGVILRFGKHEKEISGSEPKTTSQRMELSGAIAGLEALKEPGRRVKVVSDSQYLIKGMTEWIHNWIKNGRLNEDTDQLPLPNADLWRQLFALSLKHEIEWEWVKGHAGHPFNERCDRLARQAVDTLRDEPAYDPADIPPPDEPVAQEEDYATPEPQAFRHDPPDDPSVAEEPHQSSIYTPPQPVQEQQLSLF